jgi:hypothetical protein
MGGFDSHALPPSFLFISNSYNLVKPQNPTTKLLQKQFRVTLYQRLPFLYYYQDNFTRLNSELRDLHIQ